MSGRLIRFAGRLAAVVHPGQGLEVELFDGGTTSAGAQAVGFEATADGAAVVKHGRVMDQLVYGLLVDRNEEPR